MTLEERIKEIISKKMVESIANKAGFDEACAIYEAKNKELTRLEVIDESGRVYINNNCKMELSYQDEGRTLKIFVNNEGLNNGN